MFISSLHTLHSTVSLKAGSEENSLNINTLGRHDEFVLQLREKKKAFLFHSHILEAAIVQIKTGFFSLVPENLETFL